MINKYLNSLQSKFLFEKGYEVINKSGFLDWNNSEYMLEENSKFLKLMVSSEVYTLKLSDKEIYIFLFKGKNNKSCAFASKKNILNEVTISQFHKKFISIIGEIIFLWDMPEDSFISNIEALFFRCMTYGIGPYLQDYKEKCIREGFNRVNFINQLVPFAFESNGNQLLYDTNDRVYFYAHDHSYKSMNKLERVPEYTFYTLDEFTNLESYIEYLADELIGYLEFD